MKIYELLSGNNPQSGVARFNEKRSFLEKILDAEAYGALKSTMESVAPPPTPPAAKSKKIKEEPSFSVSGTAPAAAEPAPEPAPAAVATDPCDARDATVFITSLPPQATVYVDDILMGKANTPDMAVCSGTHQVRAMAGGASCTKTLTFKPGRNPPVVIKIPCN